MCIFLTLQLLFCVKFYACLKEIIVFFWGGAVYLVTGNELTAEGVVTQGAYCYKHLVITFSKRAN